MGTISTPAASGIPAAVHPHARGDNRTGHDPTQPDQRFTPTRVGTIMPAIAGIVPTPVHPHARGDNHRATANIVKNRFTPTRVGTMCCRTVCLSTNRRFTPTRVGTIHAGGLLVRLDRFTPTRVGTIDWWLPLSLASAVHPHARGDNTEKVVDSTALEPEKGPRSHRSSGPFCPRYGH